MRSPEIGKEGAGRRATALGTWRLSKTSVSAQSCRPRSADGIRATGIRCDQHAVRCASSARSIGTRESYPPELDRPLGAPAGIRDEDNVSPRSRRGEFGHPSWTRPPNSTPSGMASGGGFRNGSTGNLEVSSVVALRSAGGFRPPNPISSGAERCGCLATVPDSSPRSAQSASRRGPGPRPAPTPGGRARTIQK